MTEKPKEPVKKTWERPTVRRLQTDRAEMAPGDKTRDHAFAHANFS